jgi:hypothetical protein
MLYQNKYYKSFYKVHCEWSNWSSWSECNPKNDGTRNWTQSQIRNASEPFNGGMICQGLNVQEDICPPGKPF